MEADNFDFQQDNAPFARSLDHFVIHADDMFGGPGKIPLNVTDSSIVIFLIPTYTYIVV